MTIELFHGSNDGNFQGINNNYKDDVFNGVFSSAYSEAAGAHGKYTFKTEIEKRKILTQYDLNYEIDHEKVLDIVNNISTYVDSKFTKSEIVDLVLEDGDDCIRELLANKYLQEKNINLNELNEEEAYYEKEAAINKIDMDGLGWEIQKIRGQVAKALGFDAVEMNDEHGTSYLIVNEKIIFKKI